MKDSIRFRLSLWLSVAIVGAALAAGGLSYVGAFAAANELQDDILRQVAAMARQQPALARAPADTTGESDPESNLIVQSLVTPPNTARRKSALPLPDSLTEGLHTVEAAGTTYRVMVRALPDGQRIAVSQETRVRDEIARDAALRAVLPLLALVPLLLIFVANLVRRSFAPVVRMAEEVHGRSERELHALPEHALPSEIRPFVGAINRLLARVGQAMASQGRFVADAAHELRSPMTALSLQAERLEAAEMSAQARERLATLRQGIERGRRLLDQLLSLARARDAASTPGEPVAVHLVFRQVLEDLLPMAEARRVDIGVTAEPGLAAACSEIDLATIVRNLVDNAVRYAPPGGRVELRADVTMGELVLEVEDDGDGIPASERERVLDPFYRVLGSGQSGSGLGLSIVRAVAERLGGRVELLPSRRFDRGLLARVLLPGPRTRSP